MLNLIIVSIVTGFLISLLINHFIKPHPLQKKIDRINELTGTKHRIRF